MMLRNHSLSWKFYIVLIGSMNTRRNASRRLEDEIDNAGDPPHGEKLPPLEENSNVEPAQVNTPSLTEKDHSSSSGPSYHHSV